MDCYKCKNYGSFLGICYNYVETKDEFDGLGYTYCKCKDIDDCDYKKKLSIFTRQKRI